MPILRAGLGMLDGMMRLLPTAEVGFLGMVRNEETLRGLDVRRPAARGPLRPPVLRARPDARHRRHPGRGDPLLLDRGADDVTAICLLAAPEGLRPPGAGFDGLDVPVTVVTAGLDERLNEKGYIVPGLGDAGDRLYGVV